MPTVAEIAGMPPELAAYRRMLVLGKHATGVEIIDRSLEAFLDRQAAQKHVNSQPRRPDKRDVEMSRIWDNYVAFERMISERPLHARGKHNGARPWDLRGGRTQAPGGMGAARRSPGEHVVATRGRKIEW